MVVPVPGTRDGKQLVWQVTSSGGREHVVVVASPERLTELEAADVLELDRPRESQGEEAGPYASLSEPARIRLRGIGGVGMRPAPIPGSEGRPGSIFDAVKKLAGRGETTRGIWMRQIDLEYATP